MAYKKIYQIVSDIAKKITQKFRYLKLLEDQKIFKKLMIHCLKIIETKQNIYD